jgi:purine-nucleoside phosphorylase
MNLGVPPWERIERARSALAERLPPHVRAPRVGIVLGSGLGLLTERIESPHVVPYVDIESMPVPAVTGHGGKLVIGSLSGVQVACLSGRSHLYEGHSPEDVVFGVRLLAALGIELAILTNAAGGIAPDCHPGTLMLIGDHLNLTGHSPLVGPNEGRWGPRFVDMTTAYDASAREIARKVAGRNGFTLAEGTYAGLLGPTYETPAEIVMLERLGASAVGMSTVLETIALRHQGVPVLGISCITNLAAGKSGAPLSHDEVGQTASRASQMFSTLVSDVVQTWGEATSRED